MADALEDDFVGSDIESVSDASQDRRRGSSGMAGEQRQKAGVDTDEEEAEEEEEEEKEEERKKAHKKRKRKEQDKARKAKKAKENLTLPPGSLAQRPPDVQADHLRKLLKSCRAFAKLSELELDEIGVSEKMLVDSTSVKVERVLELLPRFLEGAMPKAIESATHADQGSGLGQVVILVVTGNAQRAADLARPLRQLCPRLTPVNGRGKKDGKNEEDGMESEGQGRSKAASEKGDKRAPVAKLFARHFKLSEQQAFLSSHFSPVAVGTPQRLADLINCGSLHLQHLTAIILDASWADLKMRTMLEGPETREALFHLLTLAPVRERISSNGWPSLLLF